MLRLALKTPFEKKYLDFFEGYKRSGLMLENYLESEDAPDRYRKIYFSYLSKTEKLVRDREVLERLVPRVNELIYKNGMNRYGVAKALSINKGNIYAFLKGDVSKLSRDTAMRLFNYLAYPTK